LERADKDVEISPVQCRYHQAGVAGGKLFLLEDRARDFVPVIDSAKDDIADAFIIDKVIPRRADFPEPNAKLALDLADNPAAGVFVKFHAA
jgi:hypothetical protein